MLGGVRIRWLGALWAALLWLLVPGASVAAPQRAVAVLYDDSGSMSKPSTRWIAANLSLQVLSALLAEGDELHVATMAVPPAVTTVVVPGGLDGWLARVQAEPSPGKGTPYGGVGALLQALQASAAAEKWLVVLTDGAFDDYSSALAQQQIEQIVKPLGIRPMFLLLESDKVYDAQRQWQQQAGAAVISIDRARALPQRMEEVAALLTGRDSAGLQLRRQGDELVVSSRFPLRNLVVLVQGEQGLAITGAQAGSRAMQVRAHALKPVQGHADFPAGGLVAHLGLAGAIDQGDEVARIRFNRPLGAAQVKVLADVAARMDVTVVDQAGRPIARNAAGRYPVCEGETASLRTDLVASNGASLSQGRSDLGQFDVGFTLGGGGAALKAAASAGRAGFEHTLALRAETSLHPYARYPGYFNFQSSPLVLEPVRCKRQVELRLLTPLGADGLWSARVDQLQLAPPLRYAVFIEGQPATAQDLARWNWTQQGGGPWAMRPDGAELLLVPAGGCCVFTWQRPKAMQGQLQFSVDTGNPRDVVKLPAPLPYAVVLPADLFPRLWWLYGCPLAALLGALALAWYLWRIVWVKERFARQARVHVLRNRLQRQEPLVRSRDLPSRWLWPSRREVKVIEGLRFEALGRRGAAVLLSGAGLTAQHEVDDWMFDPARAERRKPQPDARLRHQGNIVRRRPGAPFGTPPELRLQYSRDASRPQWPADGR